MAFCQPNKMRVILRLGIVLLSLWLSIGCQSTQKTTRPVKPDTVPEIRSGLLMGYLAIADLPDSLKLVPEVPMPDSAELTLDQTVSRSLQSVRGTKRWNLAKKDANLNFPEAAGTFSCALDAPITEADTPYLYQMLRRTLMDAGLATYKAKNEYERPRPFMQNNKPTCTPEDEAKLKENGSYPSGHTAIGWAWALILSEIAPDRINEIMSRGRAFGESRMVCNVHWNSDVQEGRIVASAVVAKLHSDSGFLFDLAAAKDEIVAVREKDLPPTRDCQAETAALAFKSE